MLVPLLVETQDCILQQRLAACGLPLGLSATSGRGGQIDHQLVSVVGICTEEG